MKALVALVRDRYIQLQRTAYIEDGWFIRIEGKDIALFEITHGGGNLNYIGSFETVMEAIDYGETLT